MTSQTVVHPELRVEERAERVERIEIQPRYPYWPAQVAGLIDIVAGVMGVMAVSVGGFLLRTNLFSTAVGPISIILGIISILGGIGAITRRTWAGALVGAIAATLLTLPFGFLSLVFTTIGRNDFKSQKMLPGPKEWVK